VPPPGGAPGAPAPGAPPPFGPAPGPPGADGQATLHVPPRGSGAPPSSRPGRADDQPTIQPGPPSTQGAPAAPPPSSGGPPSGRSPTGADASSFGGSGSRRGQLPEVGDVIGGYTIGAVLGKGGMGAVYRASGPQGKQVAIKVMLGGSEVAANLLERFRREAEAVAKVGHQQGIVQIHDFGSHQGAPYAVMELVEGDDLAKRVKAGPVPLEDALRYAEGVARAVARCHAAGVLHRDLKPANVLVRAEDDAPLLTDFGLALDESAERLTQTGELMGTPAYMPPEQAEGDKSAIDERTDVYALGAVLYELVAGRPPFEGKNQMVVLRNVFMTKPDAVQTHRPDAPTDVDVICQKALAKDPAIRYASAADFADDVARLRRGDPITARAPSRLEHLKWQLLRRKDPKTWAKVGVLATVLVAALAATIGYFVVGEAESRERLARVVGDELPAYLAGTSPLAPGPDVVSQGRNVVEALALREGPGSDAEAPPEVRVEEAADLAVEVLAAVAAIRADAPPGEAGHPRADLIAALDAVFPDDREERLDDLVRLGRRLALARRPEAPLPPAAPSAAKPEDALFEALWQVRWRAEVPDDLAVPPIDGPAIARALDAAAAEAEAAAAEAAAAEAAEAEAAAAEATEAGAAGAPPVGWAEEARTVAAVVSAIQAGVEPWLTTEVERAARGERETWPDYEDLRAHFADELERLDPGHAHALDAFLASRLRPHKPDALQRGLEALSDRALTLSEATRTLEALGAEFRDAAPRVALTDEVRARARAPVLEVVRDVVDWLGTHPEAVDEDLGWLVYETSDYVDWGQEGELARAVVTRASGTIFVLLRGDSDGADVPSARLLAAFPLLGEKLSRNMMKDLDSDNPAVRRLIEDDFAAELEDHPDGNLFMIWADVKAFTAGKRDDDAAYLGEIAGLYATALGDALPAEARRTLEVGVAVPAEELERPLGSHWRGYATIELVDYVVERAEDGDDPLTPEQADVIRELLREARAHREWFPNRWIWARSARDHSVALRSCRAAYADDEERARAVREEQAALYAEVIPVGWEILRECAAGEAPDLAIDWYHELDDMARLELHRSELLCEEGPAGGDRSLELLEARIEAIGEPPFNRPPPVKLQVGVANVHLRFGRHDEAVAAAQVLLSRLRRYEESRHAAREARLVIATAELSRRDFEAAAAQLEAVLAENPLEDMNVFEWNQVRLDLALGAVDAGDLEAAERYRRDALRHTGAAEGKGYDADAWRPVERALEEER